MALSYAAFLALPLLLFAAQAIYNIFINPLRRFPGPPLAAATKGLWLWHRVRGSSVPWITELHRQYGDVVRVAPDHLSYINPQAWKDIYGHKTPSGTGNLPKDLRYYGPPPTGGVGIISANDADHARLRRNLSHAFSEKALVAQDSMIRSHVELLVEKLRDAAVGSSSIDMVRMFNFITFDIMADLTFGESLGLLEQTEYIPWVASIVSTIKAIGIIWGIQSAMPLLMPLVKRTVLRRMNDAAMKHALFSKEHVDKRLARETTRPDIWTFVLRNQGGEKGLSLQEMHSAGSALMGAGTETTATLLSGAFWYLCTNPEKLDRLTDEVRQAFAAEEVTMQSLAQLPYLYAVLQESLRLFPPPASGLPRVVPSGGATICGVPVPEKTTVYVSHYAAYHNPSNFHDPDAFHPERWLPEADARFANDKRNVLEPFSFGPRNCVGKNLAWHEMRVILAHIVLNFDMKLSQQTDRDWSNQKAYIVWDKKPLFIEFLEARAQGVGA